MAAEVRFYSDPDHTVLFDAVRLTDVTLSENIAQGDPVPIYGVNIGDTMLRDLTVALTGDGAAFVQLAVDVDGEPGVWAETGQSIMVAAGNLPSTNPFQFWARGVYTLEDREGSYDFDFLISGTSIG